MPRNSTAKPDRLWVRFVWLSFLCALLPGFGLAAFMTGAWLLGLPRGHWYAAAAQVHAVSFLLGWGGAMILGVGLHFLPRLRGVKLFRPRWAGVLFWVLALGLILRFCGQLALGGFVPSHESTARILLNGIIASGIVLHTLSFAGLLTLLAITFRSGRPLKENKGFQQIAPLLAVAALTLLLAQLVWGWGVVTAWVSGFDLAILPAAAQRSAINLMLFGFIMAMATGMSARLFPLTFRTYQASQSGLKITAGFLILGSLFSLAEAFLGFSFVWSTGAAVFYGCGILSGTFSGRIFHRRKVIPHATTTYHMREDPAAIGVVTAYFWAFVTALFLFAFALEKAGLPLPISFVQENLARHAMGAGFMTLLIISVGWKMLPGFGGCLPHGHGYLWIAIALGNVATFLRLLSLLQFADSSASFLLPLAALLGLAAILAFALALRASYQSKGSATVSLVQDKIGVGGEAVE